VSMFSARRVIDWNQGVADCITPDYQIPQEGVWKGDLSDLDQ